MADEKKPYEYKKFEYNVPWDAEGKYTTFTPGDATNAALGKQSDAEKAYTDFVGAGYTYANQQKLNDWMSKYEGRDPFSYDFNTDAIYQQFKDKYMKQGKMAMQDTMGQAAAMTGGYGSSYASTAGNQAYQASLENLNDVIPQLYQMAYDRYNQEGQDMLNNISLLQSERGFDYGVWGDKANMLAGDRDYYQTEANNQWNKDYGVWNDNRTFDRGIWESDRTLAHGEHTNSQNIEYSEFVRAYEEEQDEKAAQAERNKTYNVVTNGEGEEIMAFDKTGILTSTGRTNDDGDMEYIKEDGSKVYFPEGMNPYTRNTNPDAINGTFSNGYQPDNIGGTKLKKYTVGGKAVTTNVTGKEQSIWTTGDGRYWLWYGKENRYQEVDPKSFS